MITSLTVQIMYLFLLACVGVPNFECSCLLHLLGPIFKHCNLSSGVDVITKFAQLEFRFGNTEKGRTMFDKILTSYPKRTDLWSIFIDLMIKHGSQKEVR